MAAPRQSGFGFFSLSKKHLESFFIGRRPMLNGLAEILVGSPPSPVRHEDETRMRSRRLPRDAQRCKLWLAKEKQVLRNWRRNAYVRYCQKFAVNLGHVASSSRLRSCEWSCQCSLRIRDFTTVRLRIYIAIFQYYQLKIGLKQHRVVCRVCDLF